MATITELTFRHKGESYSLQIDLDDAALVDDIIAFDLKAAKSPGKSPGISIAARVAIDPREGVFFISVQGEEVYSGRIFQEESEIESIVDSIPPELLGDPVTACALRAGVSAIIGQGVRCARSIEESGFWGSVSEFFRCMARNSGHISTTAMWRTFKCIARSSP